MLLVSERTSRLPACICVRLWPMVYPRGQGRLASHPEDCLA